MDSISAQPTEVPEVSRPMDQQDQGLPVPTEVAISGAPASPEPATAAADFDTTTKPDEVVLNSLETGALETSQSEDCLESKRASVGDAPPPDPTTDDPVAEVADEANEIEMTLKRLIDLELWALASYLKRERLLPVTETTSSENPTFTPATDSLSPLPPTPTTDLLSALSTSPSSCYLTPSQRQQLLMREIEELKDQIQNSKLQFEESRDFLLAERSALEQLAADYSRESAELDEQVLQDVDSRTGQPKQGALQRYFDRSLKHKEATLHLLELKTAGQKQQTKKLAQRLSMREATGESVRAIDFDQLRIENRMFAAKLDAMGKELLLLKQARPAAGRRVSLPKTQVIQPRKVEIEYPKLKIKTKDGGEELSWVDVELPSNKDFADVVKKTDRLLSRISGMSKVAKGQ